jgi:hypothetical protein
VTISDKDGNPQDQHGSSPSIPRQSAAPPAAPSPAPVGEDWTAATRYMCAGAHLDEGFARAVVQELRHERFRACAPSHGVDLHLVRAHAERTLAGLRKRNLRIAAAGLLALILAPVATVGYWLISSMAAGQGGAGRAAIRPAPGRLRQRAGSAGDSGRRDAAATVRLVNVLVTQSVLLVLVSWLTSYVPVPWFHLPIVLTFLVTLALLVGCPWYFTWEQRLTDWKAIAGELTLAAFTAAGARRSDPAKAGLPASAVGEDANLMVYSGYRPFIGAGDEVDSWAFAMRLVPEGHEPGSAEDTGPVPVDTPALVERLSGELSRLSARSATSDGIVGLDVTEKVFVHGSELLDNPLLPPQTFWPGHTGPGPAEARPTDTLALPQTVALRGRTDGPVRHALCVQVRGWGTDLVLSVFVQPAVSGATLYLRTDLLVLTPIVEAYRVADTIAGPGHDLDPVRRALDGLLSSRAAMTTAFVHAYAELRAPARREKAQEEQRWAIAHNRRFDFGAAMSLRELASSHAYRNFFQRVDVNRIAKQIELQVFGALMDYLAENGLDISELNERRNTILNNGIMMSGGVMSGSIAAGAGASAVSTGPSRADAKPSGAGGGS